MTELRNTPPQSINRLVSSLAEPPAVVECRVGFGAFNGGRDKMITASRAAQEGCDDSARRRPVLEILPG
eukprot:7248254-Prymnesium_polylepis.1